MRLVKQTNLLLYKIMIHLPVLIEDLGFILITAAVVTLLFKFLKQPVVLGYLIAGFMVGPHITWIPTITDVDSIKVWAEIGVIFLLFGLGLEFSFKKLAKVGGSASITAFFEVVSMLGVGFLVGRIMGWSTMDSLFLGGILSISSTTIIVRAFEELNLKGRNFVSLVFGVLIVEDLFAILLLVLLSTVAATQALSGTALFSETARLAFFLALWFLVGIYLVPVFLKKIRGLLNDETTLVVAIGLCLGMVMIATAVGFSPALGAFVIGSILAETREGKRIEHLVIPVRDLFAAVFFVSVGMMIDPNVLREHAGTIAILTLVTIVGKFFSSGIGALVSGRSLKNSVQAGLSLAQIGEFSFIIATLGVTLKVTSDFLYPIAVAVSAVTTFTTPYQIKYADKIFSWLERKLPQSLMYQLERYETAVNQSSGQRPLGLIMERYGMKIILNSVLVVAVGLLGSRAILPMVQGRFGDSLLVSVLTCILTVILTTPFLWAVVVGRPSAQKDLKPEVLAQLKRLQVGVAIVRLLIGIVLTGFVVRQFVTVETAASVMIFVIVMLAISFSRISGPVYKLIESRFLSNLNDKDDEIKRMAVPELTPWQATMAEFILAPQSELVAKSLEQGRLKERFGITVAMIKRGERMILTPGRDELMLPFDTLFVIGTDEQVAAARLIIEPAGREETTHIPESFGLASLVLSKESRFINKSIRDCGIRDEVMGLIVGLERQAQRILSPDSSLVLEDGDLIWVVGDLAKIKALRKTAVPANV
ncbi:Inner membrane protein YbaL [compost metagenome]